MVTLARSEILNVLGGPEVIIVIEDSGISVVKTGEIIQLHQDSNCNVIDRIAGLVVVTVILIITGNIVVICSINCSFRGCNRSSGIRKCACTECSNIVIT